MHITTFSRFNKQSNLKNNSIFIENYNYYIHLILIIT